MNKKLLNIHNWVFWIIFALLMRILTLGYFASDLHADQTIFSFFIKEKDFNHFLQPVDNYLKTGTFELKEGSGKYFAGRMPGLSFPYLILRFLFNKDISFLIILASQIILSAVSVYVLALSAVRLFNNLKVFYLTFFLFGISTFTSIFDIRIGLAESFSVSSIIFCFYFLIKYLQTQHYKSLLWSGLFLTWAIFLRPFLGLLILFLPLIVFVFNLKQNKLKTAFAHSLLFVSSFILAESVWVTVNYINTNRLIFTQDSLDNAYGSQFTKGCLAIRNFIVTTGGEAANFEQGSEAEWFLNKKDNNIQFIIPERMLRNVSFNRDSLQMLKNLYFKYKTDTTLSNESKKALDSKIVEIADNYTSEYKMSNPFYYYWIKYANNFKRLVLKSGSGYLPLPEFANMNFMQKAVKIFYSGLYYFILLTSLLGAVFAIKMQDFKKILLPLVFILTTSLTITFYSDIQESRYFVTVYPFLIILSTLFFINFSVNLKNKSF
jgi:hypothetical protein